MNFIQIVNLLATMGVTGAKQQILIWLLWENGPLTWKQFSDKSGSPVGTFQIKELRAKGLIEWEKTIVGRGGYTTYQLKPEAKEYIKQNLTTKSNARR